MSNLFQGQNKFTMIIIFSFYPLLGLFAFLPQYIMYELVAFAVYFVILICVQMKTLLRQREYIDGVEWLDSWTIRDLDYSEELLWGIEDYVLIDYKISRNIESMAFYESEKERIEREVDNLIIDLGDKPAKKLKKSSKSKNDTPRPANEKEKELIKKVSQFNDRTDVYELDSTLEVAENFTEAVDELLKFRENVKSDPNDKLIQTNLQEFKKFYLQYYRNLLKELPNSATKISMNYVLNLIEKKKSFNISDFDQIQQAKEQLTKGIKKLEQKSLRGEYIYMVKLSQDTAFTDSEDHEFRKAIFVCNYPWKFQYRFFRTELDIEGYLGKTRTAKCALNIKSWIQPDRPLVKTEWTESEVLRQKAREQNVVSEPTTIKENKILRSIVMNNEHKAKRFDLKMENVIKQKDAYKEAFEIETQKWEEAKADWFDPNIHEHNKLMVSKGLAWFVGIIIVGLVIAVGVLA